jgi:hypothetical protein
VGSPPAPRSRVGLLLGLGLALIALAVVLVFVLPSRPSTHVAPQPVATRAIPARDAAAPASATPSASASALPSATASASVVPSASAAPSASASAPPTGDYGELSTGPSGNGHRLIVDGRSVGDGPGPYRVRCGAHTVQIGSHGKEQSVDVPCGGKLRVE